MVFNVTVYVLTFLIAIGISIFAMISGGEGAIIFTPFFIAIGIDPQVAIATAFITQLFGKTSGTIGYYLKKGSIQWNLVGILLLAGIPFVIVGAYLTRVINSPLLQFLFGVLVIVLAATMLFSLRKNDSQNEFVKTINISKWAFIPAIAGLFTGIFSIGAGTINLILLERVLKLKIIKSVATVVAAMAFMALAGSVVHVYYGAMWNILPFTICGVLIGGQIGPHLAHWIDSKNKSYLIKELFIIITIIVGVIMIVSSGIF